jgi:hypothetical protein
VPLCLIFPLTVALFKGDLKLMFSYRDHDEQELNKSTTSTTSEQSNVDSTPAAASSTDSPVVKKEGKKTK